MAKLPDKQVIGIQGVDLPRRGPEIPLGALSSIGEAGRAIGEGLAAFGAGVGSLGKKDEAENDQLEQARARSSFLTGQIDLQEQIAKEPDYTKHQKMWEEGSARVHQESSSMITNPRKQEIFRLNTADDVARGRVRVSESTRKQEADQQIAYSEQNINKNMELMARAPDPETRTGIIKATNDEIEGLRARGYISATGAQAIRQKWLEGLGEAYLKGLPAEERDALLRQYQPRQGEPTKAESRNPRAAAADDKPAAPVREYGDIKFPYTVPLPSIATRDMVVSGIKAAGHWDGLPKPVQDKIAKGSGPLSLTKEEVDSIPIKTLAPIFKGLGLQEPTEKKIAAAVAAVEPAAAGAGADPRDLAMGIGLTASQQAEIKGKANVARTGIEWGDPHSPGFEKTNLVSVTLGNGKSVMVNKYAAGAFQGFLRDLEASGYPINSIGGYALRDKAGGGGISQHAYGNALDINPGANPFLRGAGREAVTDMPPNISQMAAKWGLSWGGDWKSSKDAMHFEYTGVAGAQPLRAGGAAAAPVEAIRTGTPADFVSQDKRMRYLEASQTEILQKRTADSVNRGDQFDRAIIDAGAGRGQLPPREAIENDQFMTLAKKNELLRKHDAAAGDIVKFQAYTKKFMDPGGGAFNPFDKDEKSHTDQMYRALGGEHQDPKIRSGALKAVVERTGIVPDTVAVQMRGDITSADPTRVAAAATLASNILKQSKGTAFRGIQGGNDIEQDAIKFDHFVNGYGMDATQAAQRIIASNTDEYKAAHKAKIKGEDIDTVIKKKVTESDLRSAFDPSWGYQINPTVGANERAREAMFTDFANLTREFYLDSKSGGDIELAKKQAAYQLKKVWGVTNVNGQALPILGGGTLMPYPPEGHPRLASVPNASELIAQDALASIKEKEPGRVVSRKDLMLVAIPETAAAHKAGAPAPYLLFWPDKNGLLQTPQSSKFMVDPDHLLKMQSGKRQTEFNERLGVTAPPATPAAPAGAAPAPGLARDTAGQVPQERAAIGFQRPRAVDPFGGGPTLDLPAAGSMKTSGPVLP